MLVCTLNQTEFHPIGPLVSSNDPETNSKNLKNDQIMGDYQLMTINENVCVCVCVIK